MSKISGNLPGRKAMEVMEVVHKDLFKKPVGIPRKTKKKVLDEESYVEEIAQIIQRDFFPDLEKIKAQTEYLEAMEKNDTIRLRQLHMKYSGNRPAPERIPSPATFETPANLHNSQNVIDESQKQESNKNTIEIDDKEKRLSLDQYLNHHTSQDNESFNEILEEADKKHQEKYSFLYNEEERSVDEQQRMLALPSIEQQALPPENKGQIDTWGYKNKNYIMFNPDGVKLTENEVLELNKKRQEIVHLNTRLQTNPFNEVRSKETINQLAKTQAKILDGKIGVDGKELLHPETPKIGGFSFVRSPSSSPSVLGSPFMTWGEIEGTPFRLDGGDTPLPRSQGPSFKMNDPSKREQLAMALAEKVGEKNRDQKKKALDAQRRQFSSPSPRPNTSAIDRLSTMSPAAQRLATSKLKLSVNADLRLAYTPSPKSRNATPKTPKRLATPKASLGIKRSEAKEVSTDDLLKLNLPKRQRASDFF